MQRILTIGNLTNDPELRSTQTGKTVCSFTIAVNRKHASEPTTDFFRITAWNKLGELCGKYLSKGKKVAVIGELHPRLYDAKNGQQRLSLDVEADEVEFLSPKDAEEATVSNGQITMPDFKDINPSDLPF